MIGPTGLSPAAIVEGMSTGLNTLYITRNSSLYSVNTVTGAATLVGTSSSGLFGPTVIEGATIYSGTADFGSKTAMDSGSHFMIATVLNKVQPSIVAVPSGVARAFCSVRDLLRLFGVSIAIAFRRDDIHSPA